VPYFSDVYVCPLGSSLFGHATNKPKNNTSKNEISDNFVIKIQQQLDQLRSENQKLNVKMNKLKNNSANEGIDKIESILSEDVNSYSIDDCESKIAGIKNLLDGSTSSIESTALSKRIDKCKLRINYLTAISTT